MSKKLHVDCFLVGNGQVEAFRQLVREYNEPAGHEQDEPQAEPLVEILYEEAGRDVMGFDLWFATPATGYRFGLQWGERRLELAQQAELTAYKTQVAAEMRQLILHAISPSFNPRFQREAEYVPAEQYIDDMAARLGVSTGPPDAPAYPQFLYVPKLRMWLRRNSASYFCLVQEDQLQVRRERPQELWAPDEVEFITEAAFLENYRRCSQLLRERAEQHLATYQRRGSAGNEWFYCNQLYAGGESRLQRHLRLNLSVDDYGRSWQLLYAHDTRFNDQRRMASNREEFEQQLHAMLREAEAAATGQEGGQTNG